MKNIFLLLLPLFLFCGNYSFAQKIKEYEIEIDKELWKSDPIRPLKYLDNKYLNDGKLHIHFQSSFEHDTVVIEKNGKIYGSYDLTTEWSTELADIITIPDFEKIENISISINGGKKALINLDTLNQIVVRFREKKLFIGYRKHAMYYD
jgi:hypothetical protein